MKLVVDANNIANIAYHRAKSIMMKNKSNNIYEALPNFTVKIFFNIFHKYIKEFQPKTVYIVWDGRRGSNWRKEENSNYKSNRDHSKDDFYKCLINSMKHEKEILDNYPVYQFGFEYAEADDIIYNLCSIIDDDVIVISSDGDLVQLAQQFNNIKIWNPQRKKYAEIPEYNVILYKAIIGDNSDNISGLYKFGPKKTIKAIENNLENLDEQQLQTIENNKLLIDLSLNPNNKKNKERVNKQLQKTKITLNAKRVKKLFFDLKLAEFLKKWDSLYKLLLQLEEETINGGNKKSKSN